MSLSPPLFSFDIFESSLVGLIAELPVGKPPDATEGAGLVSDIICVFWSGKTLLAFL